MPTNTCSWYQTTAAQFGFDAFNSTVIQGDSVVLVASGGTGVETLQVQTFPTASMPSGWTVVNGNDDAYQWVINRVVLVVAGAVSWYDRAVVNDTGVNGPADLTRFGGFLLKFHETGRMPNYALAMTLGIVVLAVIAFFVGT